jgi:hypothetical protein
MFLATEDCASINGSCNFFVEVKIGKNTVRIYQDFSVIYNKQKYSRYQVNIYNQYRSFTDKPLKRLFLNFRLSCSIRIIHSLE